MSIMRCIWGSACTLPPYIDPGIERGSSTWWAGPLKSSNMWCKCNYGDYDVIYILYTLHLECSSPLFPGVLEQCHLVSLKNRLLKSADNLGTANSRL
jgi:hypothetical protein